MIGRRPSGRAPPSGDLAMVTQRLDLDDLLREPPLP